MQAIAPKKKPYSKAMWASMFLMLIATCGSAQSPETRTADRIVVVKSTRTMTLERDGHVLKTYKVALGGQPVGAKDRQGDHKTPEGQYVVDAKNGNSQFYMALHLSYPNATDRARARKLGVSPGGDVEIHGLGKKYGWIGARHRLSDWTDGCIAVTNEEIEEVFSMAQVGTRVEMATYSGLGRDCWSIATRMACNGQCAGAVFPGIPAARAGAILSVLNVALRSRF